MLTLIYSSIIFLSSVIDDHLLSTFESILVLQAVFLLNQNLYMNGEEENITSVGNPGCFEMSCCSGT